MQIRIYKFWSSTTILNNLFPECGYLLCMSHVSLIKLSNHITITICVLAYYVLYLLHKYQIVFI